MKPRQPDSALRASWCLLILTGMTCLSAGDAIGPPPTFEELENRGILIFKGTALSSQPVQASALPMETGLDSVETRFHIVSLVKGQIDGSTIRFHHYETPSGSFFGMWSPETYHFQNGRTYLVVTGQQEGTDGAIQFQTHTSMTGGDGVLLCVDARPVSGSKLKDITWNELLNLLQDHDDKDAVYAITRLKQLSAPPSSPRHFDARHFGELAEFTQRDVMDAVHGLISSPDDEVAQAAIDVIANDNPYTEKGDVLGWLSAVGGNRSFQALPLDPNYVNPGAQLYGRELLSVATGTAAPLTRAKAIAAIGPGRPLDPRHDAWAPLFGWLSDPSPDVRRSAALMTADYGESYYLKGEFPRLAADPSPEVRRALALAIGFGQRLHAFHLLPALLADPDAKVRQAAAASLCSFPIKNATASAFFRDNLNQPEFGPLFLIALAGDNPADHLDELARAVMAHRSVSNWDGDRNTTEACRKILYDYLRTVPFDQLHADNFNGLFDALDTVTPNCEGETINLYRFYLNRGLRERAQKLRQNMESIAPAEMKAALDWADKHPDPGQLIE